MTQLSTQTTDVAGTDAGATAGGLSAARTLPPIAASVAGTPLSNSNTATSVLPAAAKAVLPGGYWTVGKALRLTAKGILSNIVTTPGTLTLEVRFGSTVVWSSGAVSLNAAAKTNVSFTLDLLLTCRAVGASANLIGVGTLTSESVVGAAAGTGLPASLPASAPAVGNNFDSTVAQTLDLFGTFSIANAGNAMQVLEFSLEPVTP